MFLLELIATDLTPSGSRSMLPMSMLISIAITPKLSGISFLKTTHLASMLLLRSVACGHKASIQTKLRSGTGYWRCLFGRKGHPLLHKGRNSNDLWCLRQSRSVRASLTPTAQGTPSDSVFGKQRFMGPGYDLREGATHHRFFRVS